MTTIQRFDPFREMRELRRLMHGPFFGPPVLGRFPEPGRFPETEGAPAAAAWSIPLDVRRDERQLTVNASLPGFAADDLDVSISPDRVLSVKASRQAEVAREDAEFLMRERRAGSFARAIRLPGDLDLDGAAVNLAHGVLTVTVPVAEAAQTRKLSIGGGIADTDIDADVATDGNAG